jgi:hypothetical protein
MELKEFQANEAAYEELLKVTSLPVRQPSQEDMNRRDLSDHIVVPGQPMLSKLLLAYVQKNEIVILDKLKNMALIQLRADKAQLLLDNDTQIAAIKSRTI